jgi:hypothetical protein
MNLERGTPIDRMVGNVEFLDVDENGRAWGDYLRARVHIEVAEPLMRCVAIESSSSKMTVYYEVKYEKLPMFCFSCGLIGHSSLLCPTPASRDEEGKLPWNSDRVCVPDLRKKEQRSFNKGSRSGRGSSTQPAYGESKIPEDSSPVKPRKQRARNSNTNQKEVVVLGGMGRTSGLKRKQKYVPKTPPVLALENGPTPQAILPNHAGLVHGAQPAIADASEDTRSDDSNKKQRNSVFTSTKRSADLAGAVNQPRPTQ